MDNYVIYFIIGIGLVGIIGKLIKKEKFTLENESTFHRMYTMGYYFLFFFIFLLNNNYSYQRGSAEWIRKDERIPKLNKNMYLINRTKNTEEWVDSKNENHLKELKIGRYKIIKENDYFLNKEENKILMIEYKASNLFSKKSKNYYLSNTISENWHKKIYEISHLINEKESDSILVKWNYNLDSIYSKK